LSLDSAAQAKNFCVAAILFCFWVWLVVRSRDRATPTYSPHYVNTERDYERDYQATLPQGRTAADGCKPRHGRDDRKRERSFSGLRGPFTLLCVTAGALACCCVLNINTKIPCIEHEKRKTPFQLLLLLGFS